jgi:transcriptional regulator GlxA family with amidase domain
LISHCARQPDYLTPQTSLVNAVFRVFLANSNTPMSPLELAERLGKPPRMILRTFSGSRVYKGIRPYTES